MVARVGKDNVLVVPQADSGAEDLKPHQAKALATTFAPLGWRGEFSMSMGELNAGTSGRVSGLC